MIITCPVCGSEDLIVTRENHPEFESNSSSLESATLATIGTVVSKSLAVPPVVGGLAGALIGGVLGGLFSDPQPIRSTRQRYYICNHCKTKFQ